MTTAELLAAIRIRLDDTITPDLVSTSTILEQASLAQVEFARATLVLYGVSTGTITAGSPWLTLPSNVFVVKTVLLNNNQLRPITISELDFGYYTFNNVENSGRFSNWRAAVGTPRFVVTDAYATKVMLVPTPIANATATVEGYTTPANLVLASVGPPAVTAVNPEIPEVYHEVLMAGALFRLYSLFDSDTFNINQAQIYSTQWYQGLVEAQNNLRTSLRRQVRVMELPRGYLFDKLTQAAPPATQEGNSA